MSVKIPYECITTKSPDGKESWPNVSRVTPPADFGNVEEMNVGETYWENGRSVKSERIRRAFFVRYFRSLTWLKRLLFVC